MARQLGGLYGCDLKCDRAKHKPVLGFLYGDAEVRVADGIDSKTDSNHAPGMPVHGDREVLKDGKDSSKHLQCVPGNAPGSQIQLSGKI